MRKMLKHTALFALMFIILCGGAAAAEIIPLSQEIAVQPGELDSNTGGEILESDIYGSVVNYELKKGHSLSISDSDYVFSVRKLVNGNYSTMLKQATAASFTATEDMTVGCLIRKPDKSPMTDEELAALTLCDSQYGMIGVEGYAHRFAVEAETINGGTATTRAAIFLPESYSDEGRATPLVIMTNGSRGHLSDNIWNNGTVDDIALMKNYMQAGYAVLVVDNTAGTVGGAQDWGNPQHVDSYFKAYEYAEKYFNLEERFYLHSRSMGTMAAVRIMRERPELVKCAIMCGAVSSLKAYFQNNPTFIADRFGFDDKTGAAYEADKVIGYDPYVDVVEASEYALPPTFWMLSNTDATERTLGMIDDIESFGNDVRQKTYSDTDHSGVCRLNIEECWNDAIAYFEEYEESKAEHRFCAWKSVKEVTCTESGELRRECADCGLEENMIVQATGEHKNANGLDTCTLCGRILLTKLYEKIPVQSNKLQINGTIVEDATYGHIKDYVLEQGHALTIGSQHHFFSVRQLVGGDYSTQLKVPATADCYTASSDMVVGILVRRPDSSILDEGELDGIYMIDSLYGMIGVEGYAHRFAVEAETINGGTATTRAAIFLPESYTEDGKATKLIVMTNGYSAHLTDSVWNKNTADNVGIIRSYLDAGYAVYVVNNTANRTSQTPDLGCPQLVDSYRKAYAYIQEHFNVEEKMSIHSRSFGTFAAVRLMLEVPELIQCGIMTGPRVSFKLAYNGVDKAFVADRFGFEDLTGATYEAGKLAGHDPYTDVNEEDFTLPPTFWMMCEGDATAEPLKFIEKLAAHGNSVSSATYTGTTHTGVCTLNTEEMFSDALEFLAARQDPAWEGGTIDSRSGQNKENATRLRTTEYLRLSDYSGVGVGRGYTMTNFVYDENKVYLGTSGFLGSGIGFAAEELQKTYPTGVYFRVALRHVDQIGLTAEDISKTGIRFYAPNEELPVFESEIKTEAVMTISGGQDGAIYNGTGFFLNDKGTCAVYDLSRKTNFGTFTLGMADVLLPHANSVCFGDQFYAPEDRYPLLYVNIYNNYASAQNRMEGTCCVYRITESDGAFLAQLVQVIQIGFTEDLGLWKSKENNGDIRPYGNFVVDTDNETLYAFVMRDAERTTRFFAFDIPDVHAGEYHKSFGCNLVTLQPQDIQKQFETVYFSYLQGCCYRGGKILSLEGLTTGSAALRIIDLEAGDVEKTYYLADAGITGEPEMIDFDPVDGALYYAGSNGALKKLNIPEFPAQQKTAVRLGGSVKSRRDGAKITLQDVGETTVQNGVYAFKSIEQGCYTLTVKQDGCLTYTVQNITVDGIHDVTLPELQLVAGDVNGDDFINARDITVFRRDFGKRLENVINPLTDIDGNGMVNAMDITALRRGFGKSAEKDCTITL